MKKNIQSIEKVKEMKTTFRNVLRRIRNNTVQLFRIFPVRKAILFESNPDFNDEGYWFCDYLLNQNENEKYKFYWMVKDNKIKKAPGGWPVILVYEKPRSPWQFIRKYYVWYTVEYIFDSCQFIKKVRKEQKRVFLHHGALGKATAYHDAIGDYDYLEAYSSFFVKYFKKLGLKEEKLLKLGLVRNDQLCKNNGYLKKLGIRNNDTKIIFWMPTYRQRADHGSIGSIPLGKFQLGLPIIYTEEELRQVNDFLEKYKMKIVIKPHQSQDLSFIKVGKYSNIIYLTSDMLFNWNIQLYSILGEVDALITDYSSIYFDFLLMEKNIGLTVDDLEVYRTTVQLLYKYDEVFKGTYIKNIDDLFDFLLEVKEERINPELLEMKAKYHNIQDFESGRNLYNFLKKEFNF